MEPKTNYTVVGLIVLILIAGLIATGLWLSVGFNQKEYNSYEVYMREAISGLSNEAAVKYNGVQVGFVKNIALNKDDPQEVKLLLNIEEGTPITTSTTATLVAQGITGNTHVGLSASSSDLTLLKAIPPNPYPVIPSHPSLFKQLDSVLKDVADNINKVSVEVGHILDKENKEYIRKTLANLKTFTDVLSSDSSYIHSSIKNIDIFLSDGVKLLASLEKGIQSFNSMTNSMNKAGIQVTNTMESGKVALDKISYQALPPVVVLLRRLDLIASNLEKISAEMRQNPAIILRGTTSPKLGPGER